MSAAVKQWALEQDIRVVAVVGLAATFAVTLFSYVLSAFSAKSQFQKSTPWAGVQKQWFAKTRAQFNMIANGGKIIQSGYDKYAKNSQPFMIPQPGREPFTVLPAKNVHEFLSLGDHRVDHITIGQESIASKWTMTNGLDQQSNFDVVRRQLTRRLPLLTTDVYGELVLAMQTNWPVSKDKWFTVNVYPSVMKIVSRAANRVFSGKELCRNPEYLEHTRLYAQSVFKMGALINLIPTSLGKTIAGWYFNREVIHHRTICERISLPIIEGRIADMKRLGKDYKAPHDVLQWVLDDALAGNVEHVKQPWFIARQLLILNMVAIHTTSMVTSNTIMDLYTAPNSNEIIEGLREEAERALRESGGVWTKEAVNSLLRTDSMIRETMRFSGLGQIGLPRIVKDPNGVDLTGGIHIPHGVRVVVPSHGIQTDSAFFSENAHEWDAFRFSRPAEAYLASVREQADKNEDHLQKVLDFKNQGLTATTDDFFTFGFGKHACPGRFFASQEMKLMIAHVVLNYDIKMEGPRPDNIHVNVASVPRDDVVMQIRAR